VKKTILLVNPWICDFAAYDLWIVPLGLLTIAGYLRHPQVDVQFLNCLDRFGEDARSPRQQSLSAGNYGTGHFRKQIQSVPAVVSWMPRKFFRYGISREECEHRLADMHPDLILVTSGMTYWYQGVLQTVALLRERFKGCPIILGGTYATLAPEHARKNIAADQIVSGSDRERIIELISKIIGISFETDTGRDRPRYELLSSREALPILGSYGCPFQCSYCASHVLYPHFCQRDPLDVAREIGDYAAQWQTRDIVFYDDALLYNRETFIKPLLREVTRLKLPVRFHTPNGLHARFIDEELAELMYSAQFKTIRLSLESVSDLLKRHSSGKVTNEHARQAVSFLRAAGFTKEALGIYTMIGFPGQKEADVLDDMRFVNSLGAQIQLSSYSLVPRSREWDSAVAQGMITPDTDPLLLSHTVFPLWRGGFTDEVMRRLRRQAAAMNRE